MVKISCGVLVAFAVCCAVAVKPWHSVATTSLDPLYRNDLVKGIITMYYSKYNGRQYAVLCLVDGWGKQVKFTDLYKLKACSEDATYNDDDKSVHAEPKLFTFLDDNYSTFAKLYGTPPTILLYTYRSPCSTCGEKIINKAVDLANIFGKSGTVELDIVYSKLYKPVHRNPTFDDPKGEKNMNANKELIKAINNKKKKVLFITLSEFGTQK